jgi:hypothetical protein
MDLMEEIVMSKQLKRFKLSELRPHPLNKKIYGDIGNSEKCMELMKKISTYGYRNKIIVNENGVIISGHRRFMALKELAKTYPEFSEIECEVRHYDSEIEEALDLVMCNVKFREQTREQKLREGEIVYEVEAAKRKEKSFNETNTENTQELRDIVAKIIGWGAGGASAGRDYSRGRSALKEADRLRENGEMKIADMIVTQINRCSAKSAYNVAFKVDLEKLSPITMKGLCSGQIKGSTKSLPLKAEFRKITEENLNADDSVKSIITKADLDEVVREYNAQSRGEIEVELPEMNQGRFLEDVEGAMAEFRNKFAQCMLDKRGIINLEDDEKERLNRIMTKFVDDFKKDQKIIMEGCLR